MANQCAANVSNGAAAVPHTVAISGFLDSSHSMDAIIIIIIINMMLVQRPVNVLMTLE